MKKMLLWIQNKRITICNKEPTAYLLTCHSHLTILFKSILNP
jgi:hypothetical protein